ncbi:hypothetical protein PRVXT_000305 [Proteinivorax tanatarense]|uniref:Uncharacterized protein n=1 Tax=Proteinivorax tanatarense TaxID=1260629 RepID=A0AAU7VMB2_9FIRM
MDDGDIKGIYIDAETFEFVNEEVIERYREKEGEKGIVRTLTSDSENGEVDDADFDEVQSDDPVGSDNEQEKSNEPVSADDEDAEVGIISVDEESGLGWLVVILVIAVLATVIGMIVKVKK